MWTMFTCQVRKAATIAWSDGPSHGVGGAQLKLVHEPRLLTGKLSKACANLAALTRMNS